MKMFVALILGLATAVSSASADVIDSISFGGFQINLYEDSPTRLDFSIDWTGWGQQAIQHPEWRNAMSVGLGPEYGPDPVMVTIGLAADNGFIHFTSQGGIFWSSRTDASRAGGWLGFMPDYTLASSTFVLEGPPWVDFPPVSTPSISSVPGSPFSARFVYGQPQAAPDGSSTLFLLAGALGGLVVCFGPTKLRRSRHLRSGTAIVKTSLLCNAFAVVLISATASLVADTVSIDFSGIPDGTRLSVNNNSFDGLVTISAQAGFAYTGPGDTYGHVLVDQGVFYQGSLYIGAGGSDIIPPGTTPEKSLTSLTLNSSGLVNQISFSTTTWPWGVVYTYHGENAGGSPFGDGGGTPFGEFLDNGQHASFTSVVTAPPGGHITDVQLQNWDYTGPVITHGDFIGPWTTGSAFAFTDLVLTTGSSVPEPSSLADRALLVLVLAAAPFARLKHFPRANLSC